MLTYTNYRTAAEFDAGYANSIDAAVVDHWERFFTEESRKVSDRPRADLVMVQTRVTGSISFRQQRQNQAPRSSSPSTAVSGFCSIDG